MWQAWLRSRRFARVSSNPAWRVDPLLQHATHNPDALARKGPDQALRLAAVSNGDAGRVDTAGQCRFRDNAPLPNCSNEVVLADDAFVVGKHMHEKVKGLGFDCHEPACAAEFPPVGVEHIVFKEIAQFAVPMPSSATLA